MKQNKLHTALNSLNKEEWKSLRKYVIMETSEKSDMYKLFQYLMETFKNDKLEISKEEIRSQIFPKMIEKSFLNLISRLFLLFEEWLVYYEIKRDKDESDTLLVKIYNRRGIFSLADKKYNALSKRLKKDKALSLSKTQLLHRMNHYHYYSESKAKLQIGGALLGNSVENFYFNYRHYAQLYILEMKKMGNTLSYDYSTKINILEKSLESIPKSSTGMILSKLLNAYEKYDTHELENIFSFLSQNKIKVGSDLETFLCLYGISIGKRNWIRGYSSDISILFDFNDYLLASGIFKNLGKITLLRFLNLINSIVNTQTTNKCYEFIDKWCHLVDDQDIESTRNLCYVYPKIKENKYEDIFVLLRGRKYNTTFPELRAIAFETMALYKTKEWELLRNKLNNYKRKIRGAKNKISKDVYNSQIAFIEIIEKLTKSHFKKMDYIDLSKYPVLYNKIWLIPEIKSRGLQKPTAFSIYR